MIMANAKDSVIVFSFSHVEVWMNFDLAKRTVRFLQIYLSERVNPTL